MDFSDKVQILGACEEVSMRIKPYLGPEMNLKVMRFNIEGTLLNLAPYIVTITYSKPLPIRREWVSRVYAPELTHDSEGYKVIWIDFDKPELIAGSERSNQIIENLNTVLLENASHALQAKAREKLLWDMRASLVYVDVECLPSWDFDTIWATGQERLKAVLRAYTQEAGSKKSIGEISSLRLE